MALRALALLRAGKSLNEAAKQMREPVGTLHRLLCLFRRGGLLALIPRSSTGRRTAIERLSFTVSEINAIAALAGDGQGIAPACRAFARKPNTRPALAEYLAAHRPPGKLFAAIRAAIQKGAK